MRRWTTEEIDILKEEYGNRRIETLQMELNRSEQSILNKAVRLGITQKENGSWFTVTDFCEATGISRTTVQYWINECDFPAKKSKTIAKKYVRIYPDSFWIWAEENKHRIQWPEFPKYIFGKEPDWVDVARKAGKSKVGKRRPWTTWEISELKFLLNQEKYTYPEISEKLNRSQGALKRKIYDLNLPWPVYVNRTAVPPYTQEEIDKAIDLYKSGYPLAEVAKMIGRTEMGLRGKLERSGYRITGKKIIRE
ncbi:helix-turn-helix domain-containing protein [Pisciglobus halotolerans]|uniref:Helix-turn-helix domain-containing protein n=1 Tax=Pisciglobus halotolerans TaxID=745365 RepID=A0A1I3C3K8_9LACT|nr:helix-turn-helix domain-containing protein [Pisciglobus halotolerans]SFH68916.1 hypothetical protein SAMN04489868_11266 [Pisciglobus halotolerans]